MGNDGRKQPAMLVGLTMLWLSGLLASGWQPHDRVTWAMEVAPAIIALPLMWATTRRAPLTGLLYGLIALHGLILMLGGAYTYARVPLGFWLQDMFDMARNPYDRIGHFAQGFVPAMVAREILLRWGGLRPGKMLATLVVAVCLAISALYELIEWAAAVAMGQGADAFLGTQGDPWDTQSDMAMCLLGAIAALLLLSRAHDRALARLVGGAPARPDADLDAERHG